MVIYLFRVNYPGLKHKLQVQKTRRQIQQLDQPVKCLRVLYCIDFPNFMMVLKDDIFNYFHLNKGTKLRTLKKCLAFCYLI